MSQPRPLAYILAQSVVTELKELMRNKNDIAQAVLKNVGLPYQGQVGTVLIKMMESQCPDEFRTLYNDIASDPIAHATFNSLVLSFHDYLETLS